MRARTVALSPARMPAVPLKVGVVSLVELPLAGVTRLTTGAVVSTTNVLSVLVPVLPAASDWEARAVYVPSGRAAESTVYAPVPPLRVAVRVWTAEPDTVEPA